MMLFGKQNSSETGDKTNDVNSRSIPMPENERKTNDASPIQDNSSSTISKLVTIQPDNIPMNLMSRYETTTLTQSASLNKLQTFVRL
jgi:hypothetical protein